MGIDEEDIVSEAGVSPPTKCRAETAYRLTRQEARSLLTLKFSLVGAETKIVVDQGGLLTCQHWQDRALGTLLELIGGLGGVLAVGLACEVPGCARMVTVEQFWN